MGATTMRQLGMSGHMSTPQAPAIVKWPRRLRVHGFDRSGAKVVEWLGLIERGRHAAVGVIGGTVATCVGVHFCAVAWFDSHERVAEPVEREAAGPHFRAPTR